MLENIHKSDAGNYTCLVSNSLESINYTFHLNVQGTVNILKYRFKQLLFALEFLAHKPIFENHIWPSNQTVMEGETARFDCHFYSDLEANYSWYKNINQNGSEDMWKPVEVY